MFSKRKNDVAETPNARLMQVMQFSGKDLEANRANTITEHQRITVQRNQRRESLRFTITIVGLCIFPMLSVFFCFGLSGSFPLFSYIPLIIVATAPFSGFIGMAFWREAKVSRQLSRHDVRSVEGVLRHYIRHAARGTKIQGVTVNHRDFPVDEAVYHAFIEGGYYSLYYLPATHILLSAEMVNPSELPLAVPVTEK